MGELQLSWQAAAGGQMLSQEVSSGNMYLCLSYWIAALFLVSIHYTYLSSFLTQEIQHKTAAQKTYVTICNLACKKQVYIFDTISF